MRVWNIHRSAIAHFKRQHYEHDKKDCNSTENNPSAAKTLGFMENFGHHFFQIVKSEQRLIVEEDM
jgi:hypothetical protein